MKNVIRNRAYTLIEIMLGSAIFIIICGALITYFIWTFPHVVRQITEHYCIQDIRGTTQVLKKEFCDVKRIISPSSDNSPSEYLIVQKYDGNLWLYIVDPLRNLWAKQLTEDKTPVLKYRAHWPYHIITRAKPMDTGETKPATGLFYRSNDNMVNLFISMKPVVTTRMIGNESIDLFETFAVQ